MIEQVEDIFSQIENRRGLFIHYYSNFEKYFLEEKFTKASEFLWGALHALLYMVGLTYNKKLSKHKEIVRFAKDLSELEKDNAIYIAIKMGEDLHANFYNDFLDKEGLEIKRIEIDKIIEKLNKILQKRMKKILKKTIE